DRQVVLRRLRRGPGLVQRAAVPAAAVLGGPLAPGVVHVDEAHSLGRRREKVAVIVPATRASGADQTQVGFVDQRGRLQCLPRLLLRQLLGGQFTQLIVD